MVTMTVLVAATAFIVGLVLCGPLGRSGDGSLTITGPSGNLPVQTAAAHIHIVQPGETLWSIVEASGVTGDPRPVVDRLESELHHRPLQAGQRLVMP
jgi:hypothetical protein